MLELGRFLGGTHSVYGSRAERASGKVVCFGSRDGSRSPLQTIYRMIDSIKKSLSDRVGLDAIEPILNSTKLAAATNTIAQFPKAEIAREHMVLNSDRHPNLFCCSVSFRRIMLEMSALNCRVISRDVHLV